MSRSAAGAGLHPPWTIQRYLLSLTARPFSGTLLVVLPALLLERLLRLFDLVASSNAPAGSVGRMLVALVPYYLGLALPAALFIGVHSVIARLSAGNELDAVQATGLSLTWISRPFLLLGIVVAIGGFFLYGTVQPLARYAYRAAFQAATDGGWDASIPAGQVTRLSDRLVVTADRSDRMDGRLGGVFVYQRQPDGSEKLTTGRTGQLVASPDGTQLVLQLGDDEQLDIGADRRVTTLTSSSATRQRPYLVRLPGFRARGIDEREMTLGELHVARDHAGSIADRRRLDGELHSRLVRALSLAVLPLLAVPIGLAAKRARGQHGMVVGIVILVLYHHAIQLAQSLGTTGLIDPRPALWGVFAVFTGLCLWIFRRAERHTSEGPLDRVIELLETATARIQLAVRRPRSATPVIRPARGG